MTGEHQLELLDYAAAKFHEEPGVFKLLVSFILLSLYVSIVQLVYKLASSVMYVTKNITY